MRAWWDEELTVRDCLKIKTAFNHLHEMGKVVKGADFMVNINLTTVLEYLHAKKKEKSGVRFNDCYDKE